MSSNINNLVKLASEYGSLHIEYERTSSDYIRQADPLSSEEFWPLVAELALAMVQAKGRAFVNEAPDSKKVVDEFIRSRLFNARSDDDSTSAMIAAWEKLASFTKAYSKTKRVIYKLCDKWDDLDMGDDGFGDFCDSFVLAGPDMITKIKDGDIANMKQLHKATADHPLARFMLRGENYMEMFLEEFLAEKLPSVVRYGRRSSGRGEPLEECQTPGVVNTMDLQSIVDALAPVTDKVMRPVPEAVIVHFTAKEHEELVKVIGMLKLADLVNYKKAQDSFPRLLQAVNLIVAIADHPESNPEEKISLSSKTRAQLDSALRFAEK